MPLQWQEVLFGGFDESGGEKPEVVGQEPEEPEKQQKLGKEDTHQQPHLQQPPPPENKENLQEPQRDGSGTKLVPTPKLEGAVATLAAVPVLEEVRWS